MKAGEILGKIQGLTKNHLFYYEAMGFLKPKKVKKGKVNRRDYSKEDFEKIKLLWKYYQMGFPPKLCNQKAEEEMRKKTKETASEEQKVNAEFWRIVNTHKIPISPMAQRELVDDVETKKTLIRIIKYLASR